MSDYNELILRDYYTEICFLECNYVAYQLIARGARPSAISNNFINRSSRNPIPILLNVVMELIARVICIAECNYKNYCTGQKI